MQKSFLYVFLAFTIFFTPLDFHFAQAEVNDNNSVYDMLQKQDEETKPILDNEEGIEIENTNDDDVPTFDTQITWVDYVKMISALLFVIGLIFIILKFVNQKNRHYSQMTSLENIGGLPLGTNRSIQLIRVGEKILVVGVGESIQLLKEIDSKEEVDKLLNSYKSEGITQATPFFNKIFNLKNKSDESASTNSFQSLLKKQLDDLSEGRKKLYDNFNKKDDHE